MKHLVVGLGNLGIDITLKLRQAGEEVITAAKKGGDVPIFYPEASFQYMVKDQLVSPPDIVWCCAGSGGPGGDFNDQVRTHAMLPYDLGRLFPKAKLVLFSTSYLNHDLHGSYSNYALTKYAMEKTMLARKNTTIYRVGSLYGRHRPMRTFPGKIILKLKNGETLTLPVNKVTPTPTDWVADKLYRLEVKLGSIGTGHSNLIRLAPGGSTTVFKWGHTIASKMNTGHLVKKGFADPFYPIDSDGEGTITEATWEDLWIERIKSRNPVWF